MSNSPLPPEISDYIVDLLHDQPEELKSCCLVSKPWVPRARKHLFGQVVFRYLADLEAWKDSFPDPANSPAHYTRSLKFDRSPRAVFRVLEETDYWFRVFYKVVDLRFCRGT